MSDTNRGSKGPGYEYWSRNTRWYEELPGRESKKRRGRRLRRETKQNLEDEYQRQLEEDLRDQELEEWEKMWDDVIDELGEW